MQPVYQCDFCLTMLPREEMAIHEANCIKNPKNTHCSTCMSSSLDTTHFVKKGIVYTCYNKKLIDDQVVSKELPKVNCIYWKEMNNAR